MQRTERHINDSVCCGDERRDGVARVRRFNEFARAPRRQRRGVRPYHASARISAPVAAAAPATARRRTPHEAVRVHRRVRKQRTPAVLLVPRRRADVALRPQHDAVLRKDERGKDRAREELHDLLRRRVEHGEKAAAVAVREPLLRVFRQ